MEAKVTEIIAKLREHMPLLAEKYHVRRLEIFGSYVRGRQKKRVMWTFWLNSPKRLTSLPLWNFRTGLARYWAFVSTW